MINPFKEINWSPDVKARRQFALSLIIGLPSVAVVMLLIGRLASGEWKTTVPFYLGSIGCALGVVLWLVPQIAKPFYMVWYALAASIGLVMSNLIVALIYLVVVTPVGLLMRLIGRRPLARKPDPSATTYWRDAGPEPEARRYYRQY